jgi:hypothetical protein
MMRFVTTLVQALTDATALIITREFLKSIASPSTTARKTKVVVIPMPPVTTLAPKQMSVFANKAWRVMVLRTARDVHCLRSVMKTRIFVETMQIVLCT